MYYTKVNEEPEQGATGITKIVVKGFVKLPIEDEILVEAYHAPTFSSNILSVALLNYRYEVVFTKCIRSYPACFLMRKKTSEIVTEFTLKIGLYPISLPSITLKS